MVNEVLELEYLDEPLRRVVLFNCEWYDLTRHREIRKHNDYKITEINHTEIYEKFKPLIIAYNARQVYYLPYLGRCKSNWRVVIKCKPRGKVEVKKVHEQSYQTDDHSPSKVIVDIGIPSNLCSVSGEVEIIELLR